jgi:hypothetical protein
VAQAAAASPAGSALAAHEKTAVARAARNNISNIINQMGETARESTAPRHWFYFFSFSRVRTSPFDVGSATLSLFAARRVRQCANVNDLAVSRTSADAAGGSQTTQTGNRGCNYFRPRFYSPCPMENPASKVPSGFLK